MEMIKKASMSEEDIVKLLKEFDDVFEPKLSQRVDLKEYAAKLSENAVIFLAVAEEKIMAHCAVYMNHETYAYISSIAVKKEMQGNGLGGRMWEYMEQEVRKRGMKEIRLKVFKDNIAAQGFYRKHAGEAVERERDWITIKKIIVEHN